MSEDNDVVGRAQHRIGTVLRGKYRIDRILGVGGMATVYAATHRNQAQFAVKLLHPEISMREDVRTRFLREGYVANSVKHPGAVRVVDDDIAEDGAAFLVMDLLEGATVEELGDRFGGRMPVNAVVAVADQLLDVLSAAHANSIVHRDIKPANLFVTHEGVLKVLDFGIARARDAAATSAQGRHGGTGTGMLLGTPAFMAPEQALAKSSDIDAQTDLWAVGATMFTLLAGRTVHEGDNGPQLLIAAGTASARSLAEMAPGTPPAVVRVVDCALAFHKANRFPTATAMREALSAAWKSVSGERPARTSLTAFFVQPAAAPESSGPGVAFAPTRPSTPLDEAAPPRAIAAVTPPGPQALPAYETQRSPSGSEQARPMPAIAGRAGASTARPVSSPFSHEDAPRVPKQKGPIVAAIAVAALVAIVGIGWGVWGRSSSGPTVAGPGEAQGDRPQAPAGLAPAAVAPTRPAVSLAPLPSGPSLSSAPLAGPAPLAATAASKSSSTPPPASSAAPRRPVQAPLPAAASSAARKDIQIQW